MMEGITEVNTARLPKKVQQYIERLERDLQDALDRLAAGPDDSNTFADPYSNTPQPLGHDTRIEFRLDHEVAGARGPYVQSHVDRNRSGPYIELIGNGSMVIEPRSSNVIRIRIERR
jgi:hypothetical protein